MPTYASYSDATASRVVRWKKDGAYCKVAIFDPPASFTGARPIYCFETGGGRQNKDDRSIGTSPTATRTTDVLGGYVAVFCTTPGGMDRAEAEEVDMQLGVESHIDNALLVMFLRAHATDTAVVGSTRTINTDPSQWIMGADSAGVWSNLYTQLLPAGTFAAIGDAESARGNGAYRYDPDHTVGKFFAFEGQNRLSTFCETVYSIAGASTYVTTGTQTAGSLALTVSGDASAINRANRLWVYDDFGYTTTGAASGASSVPLTGGTQAIPQGAWLFFTVTGTDYYHVVTEDYEGGAGNVKITGVPLTVTIPAATTINVLQRLAVTADYTGGAGSVAVWPPLMVPFPASSVVVFGHDAPESYGANSWACGYLFSAGQGYTWRTFPFARKLESDCDYLVRSDNPRVQELNVIISSPAGECLQRVDSLEHARSFWTRHQLGTLLPERIDLHDEGDMAAFAHAMYLAGNTSNVHAYLGNRNSNPLGTATPLPWLKGRNSGFDADVFEAFVTDSARFGGGIE